MLNLIPFAIVAQCTETIYLQTQEDIDSFPSDYGCSVIEGDLIIGDVDYPYESDIDNLDSLYMLSLVEGNVRIEFTNLENFYGLSNLSEVMEGFRIYYNTSLQSLDGLSSLSKLKIRRK